MYTALTYESLDDLYAEKERAIVQLTQTMRSVPALQIENIPSDGTWSIAGMLEHLAIVDTQIAKLLTALTAKAESSGRPAGGFPVSLEPIAGQVAGKKLKTRDKFEPTGHMPAAESLRIIGEAHLAMLSLRSRLERTDVSSVSFPHWLFGPLMLGQWLAFAGAHELRHVEQIEKWSNLQ